jgi:uncharacterized protein GlcG (DUF336 family)
VSAPSLSGLQHVAFPGRELPLTTLASGDLVPVLGGVLIRNRTGELVGTVGVSGHLPDDDEDCASQGITACGLRPDPGE